MEASWAVLGDPKRLWRHLGLSWRRLGGVLEGSWRLLGPSWGENSDQHGSKLAFKTEPKSIKDRSKNDQFLIDFSSVLSAKLEPCWPPFSAQARPRGLQDASKTLQDASKDALDRPRRPKTPRNLPWSLPNLDFERFLIDCWSIFDRILIDF